MTTSTSSNLTRYLRQMLRTWEQDERSDAELLALYVRARDDQAFATLVRRYSVLVWGVCYRILGHREEAEDAFQATFLLLARKAAQINHKELVGHWLYGVAQRTAQGVRKSLARRHRHERLVSVMLPTAYTDDVDRPDLLAVLDEEIVRLPAAYRLPLILCRLEGQTYAEAAQSLECSTAAVGRRVARAEELLRDRLVRRGVTLASVSVAALLTQAVTAKEMSVCLVGNTIRAVQSLVPDALAPNVAASIAQRVMLLMGSSKAALWGSVFVTLVSVAVGLVAQLAPQAQGVVSLEASAAPVTSLEDSRRDCYGDPLPPGALARLGTVRWRHTTGLLRLVFTRDGKGLITAGWGNPTRLWDITTGRMVRQFENSWSDQLCAAALSPDGRILAGKAWTTGDLCLWDVAKGTLLRRLKGGQAREYAPLAFSPDGKTVASADSMTLTLRLWETATGKERWVVRPIERDPQSVLSALTYSADSKALIWASTSGELRFMDVTTGKEFRRWDDENKRHISILACSPDGHLFAACGPVREATGYLARLWDVATGREVWRQLTDEDLSTVAAFSPDNKILATGNYQGPIRLLDAATGKELRRCAGCRGVALCLAFSPDGKMLASGGGGGIGASQDQTVHLWDVESGREVRRASDGHQATVCSVAFTPDGKDIVSSGWEGSIRVWDAATGEQRRQVLPAGDEHFVGSTTASITSAVSLDGRTIVAATWDRIESKLKSSVKVRQWDRGTARELRGWSQVLGNRALCSIAFSPDGKTVAHTNFKVTPNQVYLCEATTGKDLHRIAGSYPAFSPDSKLLATAPWQELAQGKEDEPGSFTLWETATAKEVCSVSLPDGRIHRLLFSPDGRILATASNSNVARNQPSVIRLWPLLRDESRKSGVHIGPPRVLAGEISPLLDLGVPPHWFGAWAFSPDGRTLAIADEGGTVRLLETATGKERSRFTGHKGDVVALSFAPDGRRLASGSRDTTILVWDVIGRLQSGRLRAASLSAKELEKLWADLASDDARRAGRAIWMLVATPDQAVPYLRERLRASAVNAKTQMATVLQFIRDLDADAFTVRQKARDELARLGEAAEPALRQALAKSPSLEMRRSLEQLLKTMEQGHCMLSEELLRGVRTLEVLEHIGSREARQILKALTADAEVESLLTQEARTALKRLDRAERR